MFEAFLDSSLVLPQSSFLVVPPAAFPRGPGFYFSPYKLVLFLPVYLFWVRMCWWVDADVRERKKLSQAGWDLLQLGGGLMGALVLWLLPWFWLSFWLLVGFSLGPALAYALVRNRHVSPADRVLTRDHFKSLVERYLQFKVGSKPVKKAGPPVQFLGKHLGTADEDNSLVDRARKMPGHKSARSLLFDAWRNRAEEVLLEPAEEEVAVRFRVDGELQNTPPYSQSTGQQVQAVYKVLAGLDPDVHNKPQEGTCSARVEGKEIELTVRATGAVGGEKVAIKIFDPSRQIHDLAQLGMSEKHLKQVRAALQQTRGVILVTGGPGSGKTTTLYGCLNEVDRFLRSVVAVEEIFTHRLMNVTPHEVKPGQTIAEAVGDALRQYPSVLMIGELADKTTAELAFQKHRNDVLILTSVPGANVFGGLARLTELELPPAAVAQSLLLVIAQKLVRALCPKCRIPYRPDADLLRRLRLAPDKVESFCRPPEPGELDRLEEARQGKKRRRDEEPIVCPQCGNSGYFGRTGLYEVLVISDKLRELIRQGAPANVLKQEAIQQGTTSMIEDGKQKLIQGKVSLDDLVRVSKG